MAQLDIVTDNYLMLTHVLIARFVISAHCLISTSTLGILNWDMLGTCGNCD